MEGQKVIFTVQVPATDIRKGDVVEFCGDQYVVDCVATMFNEINLTATSITGTEIDLNVSKTAVLTVIRSRGTVVEILDGDYAHDEMIITKTHDQFNNSQIVFSFKDASGDLSSEFCVLLVSLKEALEYVESL